MDRETRRFVTTGLSHLERIANALERLADMAEQDPLRAVDRLLAMGVDPGDPVTALETMEERAARLTVDALTEGYDAAQSLDVGPGDAEEGDPVSGAMAELGTDLEDIDTDAFVAMLEQPNLTTEEARIAAARKRIAERAKPDPAPPKKPDDDYDELPASERWRLQ